MKTSKLLLAMVLLGVPCWQGCLTMAMWDSYQCDVVETSLEVTVESVSERRPSTSEGIGGIRLVCRPLDEDAAADFGWDDLSRIGVEITAPADSVAAFTGELEKMLVLHGHRVDSIEGELRMSAGAGSEEGAELTLLLHADTGTLLRSRTFRLRGGWQPVDTVGEFGLRRILNADASPSCFRFVREHEETNVVGLIIMTPVVVAFDTAILAGLLVLSLAAF